MTKLKIEVDTEDFYDYDYGPATIEDILTSTVKKAILEDLTKKFSTDGIKNIQKEVRKTAEKVIIDKLSLLTNEDVVIKGGWGEPQFIGSVEDYIKKQIDDRLYKPVDSNGRPTIGCTTERGKNTWIEWYVKEKVKKFEERITEKIDNELGYSADKLIKKALEKYKEKTLNQTIIKKLAAVGIE